MSEDPDLFPPVAPWDCPYCEYLNTTREETEVGCEDCGSHSALWCQGCERAVDTVYWGPQ